MAAPVISFSVEGDKEFAIAFRKAMKRIRSFRAVLKGPVRTRIHRFFRDRFKSSGSIGGERWRPNTPATLRWKRRKGGRLEVLRFGDQLFDSLTRRHANYQIFDVGTHHVEIGTRVPYAKYHQQGFTVRQIFGRPLKKPVRVPPRPILPDYIPKEYAREWAELLIDYALKDFEKFKGRRRHNRARDARGRILPGAKLSGDQPRNRGRFAAYKTRSSSR